MASEVILKLPAVTFSQVKGVEMSSAQELTLMALPSTSSSTETALQRAAQLEHNIRFLREQHHLMLNSLHKEVENLRQRNRELQFQLVMSSAASTAPLALLQDISSSPEDDSRPKVILSPRQPNLSPLQVEILEKDLAELRIDLKEERDKNQHLYGVVQEQQRRIEQLKSDGLGNLRDAQCQAGAGNCVELGRKLEEAQKTIRSLRREHDDHRRELASVRQQLSRQQQNPRQEERSYAASAEPVSESHVESSQRPLTSQHRFPPLHNTGGYWQQQQNRPGMEFNGTSTTGHHSYHNSRGSRHDHKDAMGNRSGSRTTLPALHNNNNSNMYVFNNGSSQRRRSGGNHHSYNGNNNGGSRQQGNYFRGVPIREEGLEAGIQGRKFRGGRAGHQRE